MKEISMKNMLAIVSVWLLTCAISLPAAATGLNMRWLQYSPVSYFTDEDWRLAREAAREALNEAALGKIVSWENPESGASGSSTPLKALEKDGMLCRYLKIFNSANDTSGESIQFFCQQKDGTWKAAPR
jgi:surface antigen